MQHRKSTTAAVAVLLGLTLSACGGDQSVEEACEIANADAREATESLSSISPTEPEESAAALDELQATLSETADDLENEEVKTEVQTLADQFAELSSSLTDVAEAGDDPAALQEVSGRLSELGSEIMEQATTLNELCPA